MANKLYVWENVLCDYTCGVIFALAENIKDARKMILEKYPTYNIPEEELNESPQVFDPGKNQMCLVVWGGS